MMASAMRKTQTPAYSPALCGVKAVDQRGVEVETKKVMAIESAPIIVIPEVGVDVGIDMTSVGVADIIIVIDISMLNSLVVLSGYRRRKMAW
jgi:hypothetical protein